MSATINFFTGEGIKPGSSATGGEAAVAGPVMILPAALMMQLQGRRVTVLLSVRGEELEGDLVRVDEDQGDLLLENAVQYSWKKDEDKGGSNKDDGDSGEGYIACTGGGRRRVIRSCKSVMVQGKFVQLVTPTVFSDAKT